MEKYLWARLDEEQYISFRLKQFSIIHVILYNTTGALGTQHQNSNSSVTKDKQTVAYINFVILGTEWWTVLGL